jgi:hypothetical protein
MTKSEDIKNKFYHGNVDTFSAFVPKYDNLVILREFKAIRKFMCLFDAMETIYKSQSSLTSPLLGTDGITLLTDKSIPIGTPRLRSKGRGVLNEEHP